MYEQFWRIRSRRQRPSVAATQEFLNRAQYFPPSEMQELRDRKLRELVLHAYAHVPFYRQLLDEGGVRPESIGGLRDLPRLPVMTKDMFRGHWPELRARDVADGEVSIVQTGGTTGNPIRVARDRVSSAWSLAAYGRGFEWAGLTRRERRVRLFGGTLGVQPARRLSAVHAWVTGEVFVPAFELGPHNVGGYAARVRRSGAQFLIGYASACYLLARLVEDAGERLSFSAVLPTAELCPDAWADVMSRVFSARVMPYYGCGEVNSLGYTCPTGGVYHTCDEHAVIEVENDAGEATTEGEGPFLITDLDNRAMPVIRYRNGDRGLLGGPGCPCGRTLGRILRLDGRVNDMLVTTTGARISGVIATHCFRLIRDVEAFQVVQQRPGQAIVRIVRGSGYDPAVEEPKVYGIFRTHLGEGSDVAIEYLPSIAKTPAGKARFVINECPDGNTGWPRRGATERVTGGAIVRQA